MSAVTDKAQKKKRLIFLPLIIMSATLFLWGLAEADEYIQIPGLMDIRTDFSDGVHSLEQIIELAEQRGFPVLFLNDHDRKILEYGIRPFQHIFIKRVEQPSINKNGPENYLSMIRTASENHPEMILIPGAESAPFYYWRGRYFKKNLTVCDWEKHQIIIGLEKQADYKELPILHNGLSARYLSSHISVGLFLLLIPLAAGLYLVTRNGILRYAGIAIAVVFFLLIINAHPFRSSPFDQYHGFQGNPPYQVLIDYVNSRGGMVFWNHPETKSGQGKIDFIHKDTPPYPQMLRETANYTGFAALYGERITVTEPGNIWDKVLMEYCSGQRSIPAWGISAADFHREGAAGEKLGNFPTLFLVKEKTKEALLGAMSKGRMYAYRGDVALPRLVLEEFSVVDSETSRHGIMGEELTLKGLAEVHIHVSESNPESGNKVAVRLMRGGHLLQTFSGKTPLAIHFRDEHSEPGQKTYYRLDIKDKKGRIIVSNPIFVTYTVTESLSFTPERSQPVIIKDIIPPIKPYRALKRNA